MLNAELAAAFAPRSHQGQKKANFRHTGDRIDLNSVKAVAPKREPPPGLLQTESCQGRSVSSFFVQKHNSSAGFRLRDLVKQRRC